MGVDEGAFGADWDADDADCTLGDFDGTITFAAARKNEGEIFASEREVADTTESERDGAVVDL